MTSTTRDRVRAHTPAHINARLDDEMRDRLFEHSMLGEAEIAARIRALDEEWDVERYLELIAPTLAVAGIALGAVRTRKWLLVPVTILGFLAQHAAHGWCPPLAVLRRMGVRTRREIEAERYALKALRGDFSGLPPDAPHNRVTRVDAALDAVSL